MEKTIVHVTTLEQWRSILGVWFKQGYDWLNGDQVYSKDLFEDGGRFLFLGNHISYSRTNHNSKPYIEYSEFIENNRKEEQK
ncbi:hypothetical protein LM1A4_034 [Leuconostoc phage 1-A4]|uniref:Uncharacterized protein n=1 Tax=Leuconostoc phage 1-A4 TaxID=745088 RepID=D4N4K7_9CAUD|nr:hypothetical protein LM1A4_034 [Leuconostoc phage 1-A4]ADD71757.1 hypothetical protein LM1A4_034 [Leuconostoc phage 1-A4]